jgi:hypothetical protein
MIPRTSRSAALALWAMLAAAACGGEKSPKDTQPIGDGDADADTHDAGSDAGQDAGGSPMLMTTCELEKTELSVTVQQAESRSWNLLLWEDRLHLAYAVPVCADGERVDYVSYASKGDFSKAVTLVGGDAECSAKSSPVLAAGSNMTPRLFFTTSGTGSDELFTSLGKSVQRLTSDAAGSEDSEQHTTSVDWLGKIMLAYVNVRAGAPAQEQIVTRLFGGDEQEVLPFAAGQHITDLSIASFPKDMEPGGVLTYIATSDAGSSINALLLDGAGKPKGDPVVLSDKVAIFSNVRVLIQQTPSQNPFIGGIVYGVAQSANTGGLRFRTLIRSGEIGDELPITNGAVDARGVAIAPFASGYVLVFRLIVGEQASLRMRVIDPQGNTADYAERTLTPVAVGGGAPEVFVTNDGRMTVAVPNIDGDGTTLRVLRATCDP